MTDPLCDAVTGVCALPQSKASNPKSPSPELTLLSNLALFKEAEVTSLINDKGDSIPISSLPATPLTLLYFSASWCPPCRSFTPKLTTFLKSQTQLHCILINCDRSPEALLEYLTEHCPGMYAVPYTPETARQKIMDTIGIRGIPSLVVITSEGKVITTSGRAAVETNPEGCVGEWLRGESGSSWQSGINWSLVLLYVGLFVVWWWWTSK